MGVILSFSFYQNSFAQTSLNSTTDVKIRVINRIVILPITYNEKSKVIWNSELDGYTRSIIIKYKQKIDVVAPSDKTKSYLGISRKNNLTSKITIGSSKEIRNVEANELIYLSISKTSTNYISKNHIINIVY